jgi:zinc transport system substrate-binding protein
MKKIMSLISIIVILLTFSGCNKNQEVPSGKKELTIITSFYPIYIETINITDNVPNVKVINLTKSVTGCLHDYSLTTEDMKNLSDADIFVINGAGMESFLDKVTEQKSNLKIIEASKNIELLDNNPHVWVSVTKSMLQVQRIAEDLGKYDPENKNLYMNNEKIYLEKLDKLKKDMHESLKNVKNRDIITFHEAFPYFAKEFNLNIIAVIEREPGSEPSAKELAETMDIVKKYKVNALFSEPQYPQACAETIAKETGIKLFILDPVVTGPVDKNAYITIMENNLKILKEALNR